MNSANDGGGKGGEPSGSAPDTAHVQRPNASSAAPRGRGAPVTPPPPSPAAKPLTPRSPRVALEPEKVPTLTRRSRRARHPVVIVGNAVFTILVLVSVTVGGALFIGKQRFDAPGPLAEDKVVNIPKGLGPRAIGELLDHEGVIDQPWVFLGGVIVLKARGDLKHGEYKFTKHASIHDVVETMIEGKVVQHIFTVPEGLTTQQVVARLLAEEALTGEIKEIPREGTLLPDTYKFTRGMTREQMIHRMQQEHDRVLREVWDHRSEDLPIKTPAELVILASIIEKETGRADERSRVAAVFVNRLKRNMKLQSDPTIIYGLTGGKGSLGHPLTKAEIEQPTPYNTYVIVGLPPGPIANPGFASLEAAANPARTKELYFVADGSGGHVFSETYNEHLKNVAKLRATEQGKTIPDPPPPQAEAPPPEPTPAQPPQAETKPKPPTTNRITKRKPPKTQ